MNLLKSQKRKTNKFQNASKIALTDLNRIKGYLKEEPPKKSVKHIMEEQKNKQIAQWAEELLKIKKEDEKRVFEKFQREERIR